MLVNQIAVYLENKSGRILEVSRILKENNINVLSMNVADTTEYGILRAITDNNEYALKLLKDNGFNVASVDLVGFKVKNIPGEMYKVLKLLEATNISYLYSFAELEKESVSIIIKVEDVEAALALLKENNLQAYDN